MPLKKGEFSHHPSLDHFTAPDGDKFPEPPHRGLQKWKENATHFDGYSMPQTAAEKQSWIDEHSQHDGCKTTMAPCEFDFRQYTDAGEVDCPVSHGHGRFKGPDRNWQPVPHPHIDISKDLGDAKHLATRNTPTWQSSIFDTTAYNQHGGLGTAKRPADHNVLNMNDNVQYRGIGCGRRPLDHDVLGQNVPANDPYVERPTQPDRPINPNLGKHGGFSEGADAALHARADPQDSPHKPFVQNPGFVLETIPPKVTPKFQHSLPDHDVLH